MSGASAARAHARIAQASRAASGATTVAAPVMKPCATNSRRVRGRGVILMTERFVQIRAPWDFLLINYRPLRFVSCLIDQHVGAAEGRRAGRGGHRLHPGERCCRPSTVQSLPINVVEFASSPSGRPPAELCRPLPSTRAASALVT